MPGCPYCGGNHYTGEYLVEQYGVPEAGLPTIGYNQCTACNKWSKYQSTDDNTDSLDQAEIDNPEIKPTP